MRVSIEGSKSDFLAGILLLTVRDVSMWVVLPMGCIASVLGPKAA